jgi:hypothetical protein
VTVFSSEICYEARCKPRGTAGDSLIEELVVTVDETEPVDYSLGRGKPIALKGFR